MKKIFGKKFALFTCMAVALFLFSCGDKPAAEETPDTPAYTITAPDGKEGTITISEDGKTITLQPEETDVKYTITGEFEGQIINKTEGTVIILKNANLKNSEGKPVILGELKTEIKSEEGTENTISATGIGENDKWGALHCEKGLKIGGSGKCTISNENAHGVKASKVELKGSGNFTFDGGDDSSGINCNKFTVENDSEGNPRTFTAIFKDSKNGIKADETISITSGTFKFENITKVALKTDTSADDNEGETKEHKITLEGGAFTFTNCKKSYSTEENGFTKSATVTGDFN